MDVHDDLRQEDVLELARPGRRDPVLGHERARRRRHQDDPVGQEHRLADVVGDEHERVAGLDPDLLELVPGGSRGSGRRAPRTARPRAGPAAGTPGREAAPPADASPRRARAAAASRTAPGAPSEPVHRPLGALALRRPRSARARTRRSPDAQPREQRRVLEQHRAIRARRRIGRPVHETSPVGPVEPGEQVQQRRLAAARRSDQADELPGRRSRVTPSRAQTSSAPGATERLRRPAGRELRRSPVGSGVSSSASATASGLTAGTWITGLSSSPRTSFSGRAGTAHEVERLLVEVAERVGVRAPSAKARRDRVPGERELRPRLVDDRLVERRRARLDEPGCAAAFAASGSDSMSSIASTFASTRPFTTSGCASMKIVFASSTCVVVNWPSGHRSASSTNGSATPAWTRRLGYGSGSHAPSRWPASEQAEELRVVDLEHVDLAARVVRAEALVVQPGPERDVLRVAEAGDRDLLADEVVGRGDAGALADHERCAARDTPDTTATTGSGCRYSDVAGRARCTSRRSSRPRSRRPRPSRS